MLSDFIRTEIPKDKLTSALAVLREFKKHESLEEWVAVPFMCWIKLEQLEEYLEHLVEDKPLAEDTLQHLGRSA